MGKGTYKIHVVGIIELASIADAAVTAESAVMRVIAVKILATDAIVAVRTAGSVLLDQQLLTLQAGAVLVLAVLLFLTVPRQVVAVAKVTAVGGLLIVI